jgi:hypothetical protein
MRYTILFDLYILVTNIDQLGVSAHYLSPYKLNIRCKRGKIFILWFPMLFRQVGIKVRKDSVVVIAPKTTQSAFLTGWFPPARYMTT